MATLFNFNEYDFQKVLAPNILKKKSNQRGKNFMYMNSMKSRGQKYIQIEVKHLRQSFLRKS